MIEDTFRKYGETFTCVSLSGDYRIYRRVSKTGVVLYEIIKPIMQGGLLRYPGSSLWGIYGWTCLDEKAVVNKINELENNKQEQEHE